MRPTHPVRSIPHAHSKVLVRLPGAWLRRARPGERHGRDALTGLLVLPAPLSASVVDRAVRVPGEGRSCDHGHVPGLRRARRGAIGELVAPVGAVIQEVSGQLIDREFAAEATAQLEQDLSDNPLINLALGGLGRVDAAFTVLPEPG